MLIRDAWPRVEDWRPIARLQRKESSSRRALRNWWHERGSGMMGWRVMVTGEDDDDGIMRPQEQRNGSPYTP